MFRLGAFFRLGSNPHLDLTRLAAEYGNVYSMMLGSRLVVVLNGAATIRKALQKHSVAFAGRPPLYTFKVLSGNDSGLVFSNYSRKWNVVRNVCGTTIHKYVTSPALLEKKMQEECQRLVGYFTEHRGKPFDPRNILRVAVANVILGIIFDTSFQYDHKELREILDISDAFRDNVGSGKAIDFLPWLRFFPTKDLKDLKLLYARLYALIKKLLHKNRATYTEGKVRNLADAVENAMQREAQKSKENCTACEFDDSVLAWSLLDMFGAGFDTIAVMLTWALAYLVKYQQIQSTVQAELDSIIGSKQITMQNIKELHFLRATVYELLRITCIATAAIPHSTTADSVIDGYTIPKGTVIFPNLWSAAHDPKEWKDPDVFNPGRLLDEQGHCINVDANPNFLVFSAGRRKCPGSELAVLELCMFLATLLQSYRFSQEGLEPRYQGIDLAPIYGLTNRPATFYMKIELRKEDERNMRCKA